MEVPPTLSSRLAQAGQTPHPCTPHHPERDFLPAPHGVPLALSAQQFSSLANGVLPFSTLAPPEPLVWDIHRPAEGRTRAGGPKSSPQRCHHGRSEEHTSELQSHSFISYAVFC